MVQWKAVPCHEEETVVVGGPSLNREEKRMTVPVDASNRLLTRRDTLRFVGAGAGLTLLAVAAPGAIPQRVVAQAQSGGTLLVGQVVDIVSFDPFNLAPGNFTMMNQLYNVLVRYDENLQPQPELAESWEVGDDGRSLQLNLRQGVQYHSGREFTAEDVAFSIQYVQNPENGSNIRPLAQLVTAVETPDPYTAVLRFAEPNPAVYDLFDLLYMIDQDTASEITSQGVGTGPFRLEERVPGDHVTFVRNEQYWREPALLDGAELRIVPDTQTQIIQLETGTIDYAERIRIDDYNRLRSNPELVVGTAALGASVFNFNLNIQRPPFDNLVVREAMDLAIDRQRITANLLGEGVEPACLPFPATSIAFVEELAASCTFDLDAARAKLAEAGLADGFEFTLLTSTESSPELTRMSQIYQADLVKIGVTANLEDVDQAQWVNLLRASEYDMIAHTFGRASKDPASLFGTAIVWQPENNPSGFRSEEFTMLIAQAGSSVDPAEREAIYSEVARIVREQKFVIPVAPNLRPWASQPNVQGLHWNLDGMLILERAWLQE